MQNLVLNQDDELSRKPLVGEFLQENDDMKPIPQGGYLARLIRMKGQDGKDVYARQKRVSDTREQFLLLFELIEGEYRDARVPWFGLCTEQGQERLLHVLRTCGLQGDDLATLNEQVLDRAVWLIIEHLTSDSGRIYAYVDSVVAANLPF